MRKRLREHAHPLKEQDQSKVNVETVVKKRKKIVSKPQTVSLIDKDEDEHEEDGEHLENTFYRQVMELRKTIPHWNSLFSRKADETRAEQWVRLQVLASPLSEKYAWAIPNNKALDILKHYSPIVEIGSGKGYWASLLRRQGVDIICYDKYVPDKCWTEVNFFKT